MNGEILASHPRDIARFAAACASAGEAAALVFVTAVEGGSVRAPGLRMAIAADGRTAGYVSNGCVEGDLVARANAAIADGAVAAVSYGRGSGTFDIVLPCGGRIDLLIVPLSAGRAAALGPMVAAERASGVLSLAADGTIAWSADRAGAPPAEWHFPVNPKVRLLVVGTGAEALVLAQLAGAADMPVEVISPDEATLGQAGRMGFATQEIRGLSSAPDLAADPATAIALMFHDHEWEQRILLDALSGPAFYVGALGSRRAHERRVASLAAAGCPAAAIARIKAPIGLVQRLRDPHLLAASVLAEVAAEFQARFTAF